MCGKSREDASVPLCIKLQGAVLCDKPQQQNNGAGCRYPTDPKSSSLNPPVCADASHLDAQPLGKEQSYGEFDVRTKMAPLAWSHLKCQENISAVALSNQSPGQTLNIKNVWRKEKLLSV